MMMMMNEDEGYDLLPFPLSGREALYHYHYYYYLL